MPIHDTVFPSLIALQADVRQASTVDDISAMLAAFSQTIGLGCASGLVSASAVHDGDGIVSQFPLYERPYHFWVESSDPLTLDEQGMCELITSILSTSALIQQEQASPMDAQKKLLANLGEKIAEQSNFNIILNALKAQFRLAFQDAKGHLLVYQDNNGRFHPYATFSSDEQHVPESHIKIHQRILEKVLDGKTVVSQQATISNLFVPIRYQSNTKAMFYLEHRGEQTISPATVSTVELLSGFLGIGLSNESLSTVAWERANQLETIYRVTESVRGLRPLKESLSEIHFHIHRAYKVPHSFMAVVDLETEMIDFPFIRIDDEEASRASIPTETQNDLVAWVIRQKHPFVTDNWQEGEHPFDDEHVPMGINSIIIVPMRIGDEVIGAIGIYHVEPMAFSASDYQTLSAIAAHAGVTIRNARLYSDAREMMDISARDFQTAVSLREAIAEISTSLEKDEVADQLLISLGKVINYTQAWTILLTGQKIEFVFGRGFDDKLLEISNRAFKNIWDEHPWIDKVIREQEIIHFNNVQQEKNWPKHAGNQEINSWLAAPLLAGKRLLGILIIESENKKAFDTHIEWIVSSLATHAGVAIQNAQLFQQTQQQLLELGTLHQASATMTANLDQKAVLQTVTTEMVNALQLDSCTIFVWDSVASKLLPAAHKSNFSDVYQNNQDNLQVGLGIVDGLEEYQLIQNVIETRQIIIVRSDEIESEEEQKLLESAKLQSMMIVPLVRRELVMGLLAMGQIEEPKTYSDRQLRLAQNLSGQAAVAIEHSRLYGQAQRRIDELSTFHEIVLKLNSPLQLSAVLDTITESALKLIDASNLHIFLYDQKTNQFTKGSALWRDGSRTAAVKKPRTEGKGLTASVVTRGQPIVINDAADHDYFQTKGAKAWGIYAIAGFPLKYGDEVLGAFTATYLHPHTFTDDELLLLNLLAEQAAVAVRNASLYADSQRNLRDMSALVDMAKQVTSDLKLSPVLQKTVQLLRGLMNARASTIFMLTENREELILKASDGIENEFIDARMALDDSISGQVINTRERIYIKDTQAEPDFIFFDEVVRSLLVLPLVVRDRPVGTLTVDSDKPNAFLESDIRLMTIAAAQVSIAISNARLFEESEARATELEIAYKELKHSDRLKDELVQNVSHELRTPLTFVKGYVDLLMDGEMGLMNAEQQSALTIISDKTNDITRIIDDIITLQKINSGNLKLEKTSMREFLETAVASHQMIAAQKGLHIDYILPPADGMVIIDRGRINQVLDNLIGNAMKFSPDGGTIHIILQETDTFVQVAVTDEGIGISPEKHKRIFERFYQIDGSASRRFGGTGIGLAIVKRIVDAHQGRIWVESEIEKGSSFTFELPKVKEDSPVKAIDSLS
ncbi:MAG: GAF domain-containing protein [Chloroflexota bacterium]